MTEYIEEDDNVSQIEKVSVVRHGRKLDRIQIFV